MSIANEMSLDLSGLRARFSGELLLPGENGYDAARRVWNAAVDRRPALIARCRGAADVQAALGFAQAAGLPVSIRGGGHHWAGYAVWDDAVMIDLSLMKGVSVDVERGRAVAEGGVLWGELDQATQAVGLATTGADVPSVGIAGHTLGAGTGWLHRVAGLSSDNLLSAQVVTADGEVVRAAEDENPDLFWAMRGGGGNFGVATSFEFRLHPVRHLYGGIVLHPLERGREALQLYQELSECASDELFLRAMLMTAPPAPFMPEPLRGRPAVMLLAAHFGLPQEGEEALRPLRRFGPPAVDAFHPMGYLELQQLAGQGPPPVVRAYGRDHWLGGLDSSAIEALVSAATELPSPVAMIHLQQMGGAVSRVPEDATPFAYRHAAHHVGIFGLSLPATDPDSVARWTRAVGEALRPASLGGGAVNFLLPDEGEEAVRAAYGPEKLSRLAATKARYDASNLLRVNANIEPAS
jgi:hypothetical protein